jgi:hypothetical protein
MVGCGNAGTQTVVVKPNGTLVTTISAISGSDELWYDPVTGNFYVTGVNAAGDRVIDVISDSTYAVLDSVDLTALGADHVNAHSVAVDPLNGNIFVPLEASTTAHRIPCAQMDVWLCLVLPNPAACLCSLLDWRG